MQTNLISLEPSCLSVNPELLAEIVEYGTGEQCRAALDGVVDEIGEHDSVDSMATLIDGLREELETLKDESKEALDDMEAERDEALEDKYKWMVLADECVDVLEHLFYGATEQQKALIRFCSAKFETLKGE